MDKRGDSVMVEAKEKKKKTLIKHKSMYMLYLGGGGDIHPVNNHLTKLRLTRRSENL